MIPSFRFPYTNFNVTINSNSILSIRLPAVEKRINYYISLLGSLGSANYLNSLTLYLVRLVHIVWQ